MAAISFQERLERIEKGEQWIADGIVPKDALRARTVKRRRIIRFSAVFGALALFLTGLIGVFLIRYGRYQVFGIDRADLTSLEGVILDGGGSLLLVALVVVLTKLDSMLLIAAHALGALASFLGMHVIVHQFPDLFGEIVSLQWLFMVLQSTDAERLLQINL